MALIYKATPHLYTTAMTVIASFRTTDGILVSADSLGAGIDETRTVLKIDTECLKLRPITDTVVIGIAADGFSRERFDDYVAYLRLALKKLGVSEVREICETASTILQTLVMANTNSHIELLISGYARHGSSKLKPFTARIDGLGNVDYLKQSFESVGIHHFTENFRRAMQKLDETLFILPLPAVDDALYYTKELYNWSRAEEMAIQQKYAPMIHSMHIGGAVRSYWITQKGITELPERMNYEPLIKVGDVLTLDL